jgi:hypothetical protein
MTDRRMVAAAVWEDEFVGSLTFFERLLWIGLIVTCADDQGRLAYNLPVIKAKVFIYDDNLALEKIEETIQRIVGAGKLAKYGDEKGKSYLQIINWWKYQSLQWPMASKYPAPEGWTDRYRYHSAERKIVMANMEKPGGFDQASELPKRLGRRLGSQLPRPEGSGLGSGTEKEDEEEESREEESGPGSAIPATAEAAKSLKPGDLRLARQANLPEQTVYPEWPLVPDARTAERVMQQVTGMVTFIGGTRESDIERICSLYDRHKAETVDYLKPFYQAWLGRNYSKVNTGWLDWAIAGQVPQARGGNGRKAHEAPPENGNPTVMAALEYLRMNPKGSGREGALKRLKEKGYGYDNGKLIKLANAGITGGAVGEDQSQG